jgi:glycosyltransferase involved in cell wall biosynthesis
MTTYNGARYLAEQLDSFAAQTRLPDELVVGDDGSTDATQTILAEFAARAPFPVRVTSNPKQLGPSRNFAETILRCGGEVIMLSDQDDRWEAAKLKTMTDYLAAHPGCWLATHDAALMDGEGRPSGLTMGGQIMAAGGDPARDLVAGCCMAIDARLARLYDPPPPTRTHDAWLTAIADLLDVRGWIAQPLIAYRRHGANVSESYMSRLSGSSRLRRALDRLAKARAEPVAQALDQSIADRAAMVAAIEAHHVTLREIVPATTLDRATGDLAHGLARDRQRQAIHSGPRAERLGQLVKAIGTGVYAGQGGLLSLLRDAHGCIRAG